MTEARCGFLNSHHAPSAKIIYENQEEQKKNPIIFSLTLQPDLAEEYEIITAIQHQYLAQSHPQSPLAEVFILSTSSTLSNTKLTEFHSLHVSLSLL